MITSHVSKYFTLGAAAMALFTYAHAQTSPPVATATSQAPASMAIAPAQSQPLSGTLFFSREQRGRMDRARARGDFSPGGETAADALPSTLNGFVKRSDGQTMIWVDGQARYNVLADGVRKLQPQDVGNSGDSLRVLLSHPETAVRPQVSGKPPRMKKPAAPKTSSNKKPRIRPLAGQ